MAKLRVIPSERNRVDRDCVATLAKVYRKALRGEFQVVAIATVTEGASEGGFGTCWSAPERRSELAGCIGYLQYRYMREEIDGE